jgi:NAD(P)-dependent dehydrogenase (short-subunit alcohol dehydrogenase family)
VDGIGGLLEVTAEQLRELYEVNLLAPVSWCARCCPAWWPAAAATCSPSRSGFSTFTGPGWSPTRASKAGLSHFHGGVRLELRGPVSGPTAGGSPGPVDTGMYAESRRTGCPSGSEPLPSGCACPA